MLADPANLAVLGRASMELPPKKNETMNELSRWDPFRELEDMQHRLSSVLGRQTQRRHDGGRESITVAEWAPLVDISEDDKEYLIKAELPEVKKEEIKVTVENGVLVLSGERLIGGHRCQRPSCRQTGSMAPPGDLPLRYRPEWAADHNRQPIRQSERYGQQRWSVYLPSGAELRR